MPKVSRHTLAAVLTDRLADPQLAQEAAAYLIDTGRVAELPSLARDMRQYRFDEAQILEVNAVSAHPLTEAVRADIKQQLTTAFPSAQQIIINERSDESVIGGIRLELANQQMDATVKTKLNQFKQLSVTGKV